MRASAGELGADVSERRNCVNEKADAELMGELPHQVVFRALGAVGAVVVRGGTVARNDSQLAKGLDLFDRRGHALAGADQQAQESCGGELDRGHAL